MSKRILILATAAMLSAAGTSRANQTAVYANDSGEPSLISTSIGYAGLPDPKSAILDDLYGLNNLVRVDDDWDQIWSITKADGTADVELTIKYAANTSDFGVVDSSILTPADVNPVTDFKKLAKVSGYGTGVYFDEVDDVYATKVSDTTILVKKSGSSADPNPPQLPIPNPFAFAVRNMSTTPANVYTSIKDQNADGLDHMVTYKVMEDDGNGGQVWTGAYVIAFEDRFGSKFDNTGFSDRDFNDAVFEIRGFSATPEPSTLALGGLAAVIGAGVTLRRRRAQAKA